MRARQSCSGLVSAPVALSVALLFGACGEPFTAASSDAGVQGQGGQSGMSDASGAGGGSVIDRVVPTESGPVVNLNARIHCSTMECDPKPAQTERCCILNAADLNDYCYGGVGQPPSCHSDIATTTVMECDDAEDCLKAGKPPGSVCCARGRDLTTQPGVPVWASISCIAPTNCRAMYDDVFCASDDECSQGKKCIHMLGPYKYCE